MHKRFVPRAGAVVLCATLLTCWPASQPCSYAQPAPACVDVLTCSLPPLADTRIEVGEGAAWDHGLEEDIEADAQKRAIGYLKFDLSGITGRVRRATLRLFCTDSSPDGGTVYPVRDSSWVEGTERAAPGPGLKWIEVDADGDGSVGPGERSRYAPDFTQPIAKLPPCVEGAHVPPVIITKAFQNGPGTYSLAIANDDADSAKYASRELADASKHPALDLEFAYVCGNLRIDPGESCEDGNFVDGDGCDSNCTLTGCGNGIVTAGEVCDDGSGNCTAPCCGNGVIESGEQCDDGASTATCDADCTPARCGDGTRNPSAGEGCDDGNTAGGDGCEANCGADCCASQNVPGCDASLCDSCVCGVDPFCCSPEGFWDERCVFLAETTCDGACLCGSCGDSTVCRIRPVADTYVEGPDRADECAVNDCPACGQATWDHGGRERLEVEADGHQSIGYLKFDLRGLRPTDQVEQATLRLFAVRSADRGGSIFPLSDSTWVEGACDGVDGNCACVPGDASCACDPGDGSCFAACKACVEEVECPGGGEPRSCKPVGQCLDPGGLATCEFQAAVCDALECLVDGVPTLCQPALGRFQDDIDQCVQEGGDELTCTIEDGLQEMLACEVCEDFMPCEQLPTCENVPALKFIDVDTNADGVIAAGDESPFLPDFAQPPIASFGTVTEGEAAVAIVTDAFQRGPALYSLALAQAGSGDRATYATNETLNPDQQPLLEVTLAFRCAVDADCPTEKPCVPRTCEDERCVEHPKSYDACEPCSNDLHCDDDNPCSVDSCGDIENGCTPSEPILPNERGLAATTCALAPYPAPACTAPAAEAFAFKLDRQKSRLCERLTTPCVRASRNDASAPPRRQVRKVVAKALTKLRNMKREIVLKAAGLRGKSVSTDCARLLGARVDLARSQLLGLKKSKRLKTYGDAGFVCGSVTQTSCTTQEDVSEVYD